MLSTLPVEVHFEILKYAQYSSQYAYHGKVHASANHPNGSQPPTPIEWKWSERNRRSLSQFPYNVAAASRLWKSVLMKMPECWTRVIIDVSTDPSKFLDIFQWSKDLPKLEVTIFNSHQPDPEDASYSLLERERVANVVDALRPHVPRCEHITIDVAFMTSLPSPVLFLLEDAPYLKELVLECRIDNAGLPEEYSRTCDLGVYDKVHTRASLPKLKLLSLTGFWFMFVTSHPHTQRWSRKIFRAGSKHIDLTVSQFQFQTVGKYTLQNFVVRLDEVKPDPITLRDFSLNHDGPVIDRSLPQLDLDVFSSTESIKFENVSPDVLRPFFLLVDVSPTSLTISNCVFPPDGLFTQAAELILQHIGHPNSANSFAKDSDTTNLSKFLRAWSGYSLRVDTCPAFDDAAFSALLDHFLETPTVKYIYMSDCDSFTVRGVRRFLRGRNDLDRGPFYDAGYLAALEIYGHHNCPFPTEKQQKWFRSSDHASDVRIVWELRPNPENGTEMKFHKDGLQDD